MDLDSVNGLNHLHQTNDLRTLLSQHKLSKGVIDQIIRFETDAHDQDIGKVLCCMKNNLNPETVAKIADALKEPSCKTLRTALKDAVDCIKSKFSSSKQRKSHFVTFAKMIWKFLVFTFRTFILNVDLIKDVFLLVKLESLLGGIDTIIAKPTIFQNTVSQSYTIIIELNLISICTFVGFPVVGCLNFHSMFSKLDSLGN